MIFTAFSENFLLENKLAADFSQTFTLTAFSWPLANFPDFPLVKKNHISFCNHIYNYLYYSFSLITLSLTHFGCAVIVPDASNSVQMIGTIIWKSYPDDRKWPGWLRWSTSIDCLKRVEFYADDCEDRDLEMLSDDWDYQDDQRLSQKSSLSFH